ncbi:MAG: DegV family protein [Mobilitalea sp.]
MRDFIISTDSTADLPKSYLEDNNILLHPLHYIIDETEYGTDISELSTTEFYKRMRNGKMPTTSATNPDYIMNLMKEQTDKGFDILHISFSSALSCSHDNALFCAQSIMDEAQDVNIVIVDSLCATAGQGLMVYKAVEMKKMGKKMKEIAAWVNENKQQFALQFIVDDLHHLVRGGRLSKSMATIGSVLHIQPLLHVDNNGKLSSIGNIRGRKKALNVLANNMVKKTKGLKLDIVFISHADCISDAKYVADRVKNKYNIENIMITEISPTIGAHTGAGAVVISYYANER